MPFMVFISHASRDKWVAGQIAKEVVGVGATCFLDSNAIETGDRFDDELRAALEEATEFLVLLTPAALERPYVWIEIGAAWSQGKRIIGILHGMTTNELAARDGAPAFLKGIHLRDITSSMSTSTNFDGGSRMPETIRPTIFLSYSKDQVFYVRAVAEQLQRRGLATWLDDTPLAAGDEFRDTLFEAIGAARIMIVFLSGETLDSPWVNFEIGAAVGRHKRVIPVFLTEEARRFVPPFLSEVAGIDAHDLKPGEVAERIADVVGAT